MLQDARLLCSDLVAVEWNSSRTPAILDDISRGGACIQLEQPIPTGTAVKLICGYSELKGEVRSCRYRQAIGYYIGIAFADECTWSKKQYRPPHLVDPDELRVIPPCAHGLPCQHCNVRNAAAGETSRDKVRKVAQEVARVCRNLDLDLVKSCYRNLYEEHRGDGLLHDFVEAYYEALRVRRAGAGSSG